ncbi:UNVERIFIED_CONTAM: hypothetical protein LJA28_08785 [Campylobacter jejuni]
MFFPRKAPLKLIGSLAQSIEGAGGGYGSLTGGDATDGTRSTARGAETTG